VRLSRHVGRGALAALLIALIAAQTSAPHAAEVPGGLLERFLSMTAPAPYQVRALRHLEARSERFDATGWMDVWTESDRNGFRYQVVNGGGSGYIRDHVLLAELKSEQQLSHSGAIDRAALTRENYEFSIGNLQPDGLVSMAVKPRRSGALFVDGSIYLNPADGDLVRLEGRLVTSPSFWTRRVDVVRWFKRVAGVRMPVAVESLANVRIAGKSTFRMDYEYESVNGQRVGNPQPRMAQLR